METEFGANAILFRKVYHVKKIATKNAVLPKRLHKFYQKAFAFGSYLGAVPYRWAHDQSCPVYTKSKSAMLIWKIWMYYYLGMVLFALARIPAQFQSKDSIVNKLYALVTIINYVFALPPFVDMVFYSREYLTAFCRCIKFFCRFQETLNANQKQSRLIKVYSVLIPLIAVSWWVSMMSIAAAGLFASETKTCITSILWDCGYGPIIESRLSLRIAVAVTNGILMAGMYCVQWPLATNRLLIISAFVPTSVSVLGIVKSKEYELASIKGQCVSPLGVYHQLMLLTKEFNAVMASVLATSQFIIIGGAVVCTCIAIRFHGIWGSIAGVVGFMGLASIIGIFYILSQVGEQSRRYLRYLKASKGSGRFDQGSAFVLKTLTPLWIQAGTMYCITSSSLLTMCQITFDRVVDGLLLTY